MERDMLTTLQYNVSTPTSYQFMVSQGSGCSAALLARPCAWPLPCCAAAALVAPDCITLFC